MGTITDLVEIEVFKLVLSPEYIRSIGRLYLGVGTLCAATGLATFLLGDYVAAGISTAAAGGSYAYGLANICSAH